MEVHRYSMHYAVAKYKLTHQREYRLANERTYRLNPRTHRLSIER